MGWGFLGQNKVKIDNWSLHANISTYQEPATEKDLSMELTLKSPKISDPQSSPKARGKRLKMARMVLDLTRHSLEGKYQISASTVQSWESAKSGGLTRQGAVRILVALQQEGLNCSLEWLLYGVGMPPRLASQPAVSASVPSENIIQELILFRSLNENALSIMLTDDGMSPHYQPGDYVAGRIRTGEAIKSLINQDCIIETAHNEILLRRLKPGSQEGLYHLQCTNPETTVATFTLYNQQVKAAAPIIWHRRGTASA